MAEKAKKAKNFSQQKGKRAEREVCAMLQPVVDRVFVEKGLEPVRLERNLMQSMKGGYDIVGLDWIAIEVKHHETLNLKLWWVQARQQAEKHQVPVLFYKRTRAGWSVRMNGRLAIGTDGMGGWVRAPVDISLAVFLQYFEKRLSHALEISNV